MRCPRFSIAALMGIVALAAIGCAAVPYLLVSPGATLAAATLTVSILAVIRRGSDRRLNRSAIALALVAILVSAAGWSYSLWQHAVVYRRLSIQYARAESVMWSRIDRYDQQDKKRPIRFHRPGHGLVTDWPARRPFWVSAAEYYAYLKLKYERLARYPWLPLEPTPPMAGVPSEPSP